jgi:predicted alpha/beta-hydrolase family hydrolase
MNTFKFENKSNSDTLDILLHGATNGIDSHFMTTLYKTALKNVNSVLTFNFSYIDQNREFDKSEEMLKECVEDLENIMKLVKNLNYKEIRFIGKSLGAIVASEYLKNSIDKDLYEFSLVCFGYTLGHINIPNGLKNILVVHGEHDRFGNLDQVKQDTKNLDNVEVIEIKNADHSFKEQSTDEPLYVHEAIAKLYGV